MKDGLDREAIERLAANLARGFDDFNAEGFAISASEGLEALELKARVAHVAAAMRQYLPEDPHESIRGILGAIPDWDRGDARDSLRGFAAWPVFVYVEIVGAESGEFALRALGKLTHLFTAEFSVRSFVQRNPGMAMSVISEWARDPDDQVRRLASEGIRTRLPWASTLPVFIQDPDPIIRILDALVDDESLYVRRSVANSLSDIAADHPDLAIATCKRWLGTPNSKRQNSKRQWVAKRATRNLIKGGHAGVWELHGFTEDPKIEIRKLEVEPQSVSMDQSFAMEFVLVSQSSREQRLVIDFVVHHVKAGGKSSPKVFKLCELALGAGQVVPLRKQHAFRTITTRRYYPGPHRIEIQVNGVRHSEAWVNLV